jgi:hypothetical protein
MAIAVLSRYLRPLTASFTSFDKAMISEVVRSGGVLLLSSDECSGMGAVASVD